MIIPIIGLLLGIAIGIISPITIPIQYSSYMSVAILAALDSVFEASGPVLKRPLILRYLFPVFRQRSIGCDSYIYWRPAWSAYILCGNFCLWVRLFQNLQ